MNKKRILAVMLTLALVLSLAFAFAACTDDQTPAAKEGAFRVVLMPKEGEADVYTIDMALLDGEKNGEAAVMQLAGNHGVSVTWEESSFGKYLIAIGCVQPTEANEYVRLFTSVEKDKGVDAYATTIEYDGVSLTSSAVGISLMTVEPDCVILIKVDSY